MAKSGKVLREMCGGGKGENGVRSHCTWNRLSCGKKRKKNDPVTEIATLSFAEEAAGRAEPLGRDVILSSKKAAGVLG